MLLRILLLRLALTAAVPVTLPAMAATPPRPAADKRWVGPVEDTTLVNGLDHEDGSDWEAGVLPSASACAAACHAAANCTGWTWQDTSHRKCHGGEPDPTQKTICWLVDVAPPSIVPTKCPGHVSGYLSTPPSFPVPTARQMQWMRGVDPDVGGLSQFMHFGIPTFWARPVLASWVVRKGSPEPGRDILRAKPPARAHNGASHCGSNYHQLGVCLTPHFLCGAGRGRPLRPERHVPRLHDQREVLRRGVVWPVQY